ncbi:hypothetical protein ACVBEJ_11775 [Porticoccus sp. GXU_MW_L64]
MIKKLYAALVLSVVLSLCLVPVIGRTAAIAIPQSFFEFFGYQFGRFLLDVLIVTVPYFLVSIALLPLLGFAAKAETFRYSFVTLVGFLAIVVWETGGFLHSDMSFLYMIPLFAGLGSIVLAGWIGGRRYVPSRQ